MTKPLKDFLSPHHHHHHHYYSNLLQFSARPQHQILPQGFEARLAHFGSLLELFLGQSLLKPDYLVGCVVAKEQHDYYSLNR